MPAFGKDHDFFHETTRKNDVWNKSSNNIGKFKALLHHELSYHFIVQDVQYTGILIRAQTQNADHSSYLHILHTAGDIGWVEKIWWKSIWLT